MAIHLLNKSFLDLLTAQNSFLLNKSSETQYFILDCYIEIVVQGIIPDTGATKVSTTDKNLFKALQ